MDGAIVTSEMSPEIISQWWDIHKGEVLAQIRKFGSTEAEQWVRTHAPTRILDEEAPPGEAEHWVEQKPHLFGVLEQHLEVRRSRRLRVFFWDMPGGFRIGASIALDPIVSETPMRRWRVD